jgi:hypothetical protein
MTFIEYSSNKLSPLFSLFLTSLYAAIFFHLVNFKDIKEIYKKCCKHKTDWLLICANVLITWVVTFYGSAKLGSFGFIFITFITAAIISFGLLQIQQREISGIYCFTLISLLIVLMVGVRELWAQNFIYSITSFWLGIIGGIFSYLYRRQSYIFSQKTGLKATQVLAIRFYGVLLITGFLTSHDWLQVNLRILLSMLLLSFIVFIIPIFFNQKGITQIGAEQHSIISATCPAFTYLVEAIHKGNWSNSILLIGLIASFLLMLPYFYNYLRTLRKSRIV